MVCPNCLENNPDNAKICQRCGQELSNQANYNSLSNIPNIFVEEPQYNIKSNTYTGNIAANNENFKASVLKDGSGEVEKFYTKNDYVKPEEEPNIELRNGEEFNPSLPNKEKEIIKGNASQLQEQNKFINNVESTPLKQPVMDSNNNILQNPVAEEVEKPLSDKVNIIVLIRLLFGSLTKPGTTIKEKTRAYNKTNSSIKIFLAFSSLTFIAFIVSNVINGCFIKVYDINTGTYNTTLDFANIVNLDLVSIALIGVLLCYGVTFLVTAIYHCASFVSNRGLTFGRYLSVITLSLLPFMICLNILSPILSIPSYSYGVLISIFGIIYSFIILITTLNDLLTFKFTNQKIMYHTIILTLVFIIIALVSSLFLKDVLSALKLTL